LNKKLRVYTPYLQKLMEFYKGGIRYHLLPEHPTGVAESTGKIHYIITFEDKKPGLVTFDLEHKGWD
jgi:hypothetical protein